MHQEQFPVPKLPNMTFQSVSLQALHKNMPDFVVASRWHARLAISIAFLTFAAITIASCVYFGLTTDAFFIATLSITLLAYLISMPIITNAFIESDRVTRKVTLAKNAYLVKSLANTPLEERLDIANGVWASLRSEEWNACISYAHAADKARTAYCCQQIGKIASDLTHNSPEIFSDAMLKTMNNQRGSASYFFDILVMLGEQQFHEEHEEQRKVRSTKKLLLDDLFT